MSGQYVQDTISQDTQGTNTVYILNADDIFFEQKKEGLEQLLIGNITLYQDSTFFYCDTAVLFNNTVRARGNIQILQGDSTSIFSDSLFYSGDTKTATLMGEVILQNKENELYTEDLSYDLRAKVARYDSSGVMKREGISITSVRGKYFLDSNLIKLQDSVIVVDTNFVLQADSLNFLTEDKKAVFIGPTRIQQENNRIYCEDGYYDMLNQRALFETNASFVKDGQYGKANRMKYDDALGQFILVGDALLIKEDQRAFADSIVYFQDKERAELYGHAGFQDAQRNVKAAQIIYDEQADELVTEGDAVYSEGDMILNAQRLQYDDETGNGWAEGNVVWKDTANDLSIFADRMDYNDQTDYIKATGRRPWIEIYTEDDTMYISGDTLISDVEVMVDSVGGTSDSTRRLKIYHDVRIFKQDIQGVCDSMVYSERDSVFQLFKAPVLWSDTSQFSGDTIDIYMKKKNIDFIHQKRNGLIINSTDLTFYNQIQGKQIKSYFKERKPDFTLVEGNAQSLYFATDEEDAYIAANKSICSKIKVKFGEKKIKDILFIAQPEAEMLPMSTPGLSDMRLEGFKWEFDSRPKSKEDVWK